jgi:Domain of unknown function (DUF6379)
MYEKYMIVPEQAQNTENGFQIGARLPYYRGISLSMVEEIEVSVDEETLPQSAVVIMIDGKTYNLEQRENETADRWEMGDVATLCIEKAGGLPTGEHTIGLKINLRIGYMPFPSIRMAKQKVSFN